MKIAISPCPNDTYLFYGWVKGLVGEPPEVVYGDIQQLNEWALTDEFDLIKISCAQLPHVSYELLPVGAALGHGPLVIAKEAVDLSQARVAIPGRNTTAYHLLRRYASPGTSHFCRFDEAFELLKQGEVDAAVIIHEQRFTYEAAGFQLVCDLGKLWEEEMATHTPLGCLVARDQGAAPILRQSLEIARKGHPGLMPYIQEHAQEMALDVVQKHIDAYVTAETAELSEAGRRAILCLSS